jgi:hypothetical protein
LWTFSFQAASQVFLSASLARASRVPRASTVPLHLHCRPSFAILVATAPRNLKLPNIALLVPTTHTQELAVLSTALNASQGLTTSAPHLPLTARRVHPVHTTPRQDRIRPGHACHVPLVLTTPHSVQTARLLACHARKVSMAMFWV